MSALNLPNLDNEAYARNSGDILPSAFWFSGNPTPANHGAVDDLNAVYQFLVDQTLKFNFVRLETNQSIPSGLAYDANQIIKGTSITGTTQTPYDSTTGFWTISEDGNYLITGYVEFDSGGTASNRQVFIRLEDADLVLRVVRQDTNTAGGLSFSFQSFLLKDEQVGVGFQHASGANRSVVGGVGGDRTKFQISKTA